MWYNNLGDCMINYILKYGNYTFSEEPFNEVDNLVFSVLAYIDYNEIVSNNNQNKKTLEKVGQEFFNKHKNLKSYLKKQIFAVRNGIKILDLVRNTKRFKDILLYNYSYIGDKLQQFSAVTFEINHKLIYVAFEGTDQLLSGWEEDFRMVYEFPVEAQKAAINYLNKFTFKNKKIIVGGHSKGGNLALVSSMYTNFIVKRKILKIYSNDGQGLRLKQKNSPQYKSIKERYTHIIPNYSVVGMLLRHDTDYKVVKSTKFGLESHDALTWVTEEKEFKNAPLSRFSKTIEECLEEWLDKYTDEERKRCVTKIFDIFREHKINSLIDIIENKKNIIKLLKSTMSIDKEVSNMFKDLFNIIKKSNIDYYVSKYIKNKKENELVN